MCSLIRTCSRRSQLWIPSQLLHTVAWLGAARPVPRSRWWCSRCSSSLGTSCSCKTKRENQRYQSVFHKHQTCSQKSDDLAGRITRKKPIIWTIEKFSPKTNGSEFAHKQKARIFFFFFSTIHPKICTKPGKEFSLKPISKLHRKIKTQRGAAHTHHVCGARQEEQTSKQFNKEKTQNRTSKSQKNFARNPLLRNQTETLRRTRIIPPTTAPALASATAATVSTTARHFQRWRKKTTQKMKQAKKSSGNLRPPKWTSWDEGPLTSIYNAVGSKSGISTVHVSVHHEYLSMWIGPKCIAAFFHVDVVFIPRP